MACKIYINIILLIQTYDRVQELISIEQLQLENSWCCLTHWCEISAATDEDLRQNRLCSYDLPFETEQTVGQNTLLISHDSVELIRDHPLANPARVSLHSPRFNYCKSV